MAGGIASALFLEAKAEPIKFCSARQQAGYAQILLVERNGWEYPIPFEDLRPRNKFRFVDSGVSARRCVVRGFAAGSVRARKEITT